MIHLTKLANLMTIEITVVLAEAVLVLLKILSKGKVIDGCL